MDRYDQAGQYRVLCAHITQAAVLPQSLGNCMRKGQNLQEENNSEVREKPATEEFAGPKKVRDC
jgi:hypothetical protein